MDITNSKGKRGRPATGRAKDAVIFLRVPAAMKEEIKRRVKGVLTGSEVDRICEGTPKAQIASITKEWVKERIAEDGLNVPPTKEAHDASQYLTEISELKAQNLALAEQEDRLMGEIADLKEEVERIASLDLDGKGNYWRTKYFETVKQKSEFDQT